MTQLTFRERLQQMLDQRGAGGTVLGIDLGTTKSCVAVAEYESESKRLKCSIFHFKDANRKTAVSIPSVVALDHGCRLVGEEALEKRGKKGFIPERTFFSETKNTIGLRYTYPNGKPGFANATDIAAHLLDHLHRAACRGLGYVPDGAPVVACPASFNASQRLATILAAERAVLGCPEEDIRQAADDEEEESGIRLLDEPYAAFLDLLFREPPGTRELLQPGNTLMVFDFGGGTCDVAIFRIDMQEGDSPIGARLLSSSRYHRLGGGDIDRAIVHEVLIPRLVEENGLGAWELGWHDKVRRLEPLLIDGAVELKLQMSHLLANNTADENKQSFVAIPALDFNVEIGGVMRHLEIKNPVLERSAFLALLNPFLDPEPQQESGDEFVQRSSIFSPIRQALLRAGLEPRDMDGVLICGCCSLLPPVQATLRRHFPHANCVLMGKDVEELQGVVARGAALQALAKHLLGRELIKLVCSSDLSLVVTTGTVALAKAGEELPVSSNGMVELHPPRDSEDASVDIAVEVVIDDKRLAGRALWQLLAPVAKQDVLLLSWHLDDNQCLVLNLQRENAADEAPLVKRFDSPITHCDMGQMVRCRMLERMEAIRSGAVERHELGDVAEKIAQDAATLGEYERALHFVSIALQERGDDPYLLNLRGIYRKNLGDLDGALDAYRQAAVSFPAAHFNLALLHYNAARYSEALREVDAVLEAESSCAYHVLRGDILDKIGRSDEAMHEWQTAIGGDSDLNAMSEFELGWLSSCARMLSQPAVLDKIQKARDHKAKAVVSVSRQGELPVYAGRPLRDLFDLV